VWVPVCVPVPVSVPVPVRGLGEETNKARRHEGDHLSAVVLPLRCTPTIGAVSCCLLGGCGDAPGGMIADGS